MSAAWLLETTRYRLLAGFEASRDRYETARRALPERWRADRRPAVQEANDLWVSVIVRIREHQDQIAADLTRGPRFVARSPNEKERGGGSRPGSGPAAPPQEADRSVEPGSPRARGFAWFLPLLTESKHVSPLAEPSKSCGR